jgi:hypothetical protein
VFVSQSVDGVIYVARVPPAELLEPFTECSDPSLSFRVALTIGHQHADPPHPLALLRARRERPSCRRAAEQRDELAAPHHSITSSARASSVGGISRPSAFAVLRLITNSYLVGACTGRSPGFSPLRMRAT